MKYTLHMNDCKEWPGQMNSNGYGRLSIRKDKHAEVGKKQIQATHFVWELLHGPVPDGMVIRHKCDNPPCVNPEHLELGTQGDNVQDMVERGRADFKAHARKDHCKNDHPFTAENTYMVTRTRNGVIRKERQCKECVRIRSRERYRRNNPDAKLRGVRVTIDERPGA